MTNVILSVALVHQKMFQLHWFSTGGMHRALQPKRARLESPFPVCAGPDVYARRAQRHWARRWKSTFGLTPSLAPPVLWTWLLSPKQHPTETGCSMGSINWWRSIRARPHPVFWI